MFKRSYRKNIGLMAGVEFFAFLGITSFWILFLSQNGMSLWQIGLLESIFHATSVICEIPSGMLADRFSYKTNLYLSRIAGIVSSVLMLAGQGNFLVYALSMVLGPITLIRGQVRPWFMIHLWRPASRNIIYPSPVLCLGWLRRLGLWERSGLDFLSTDNCI